MSGGSKSFSIALVSAGTDGPAVEAKSDQHGTFAIEMISGTYDVYIRREDLANRAVVVIQGLRIE
jgi:hypothetical protein